MNTQTKDVLKIETKRIIRKNTLESSLTLFIASLLTYVGILLGLSLLWVASGFYSTMPNFFTLNNFIDMLFKQLLPIHIVFWSAILLIPIIGYFVLLPRNIKREYKKSLLEKRKTYLNSQLVVGKLIAIKVVDTDIDTDNRYHNFIINLSKTANFYATLNDEDDLIHIYAKINGEENDRLIDIISKNSFLSYYQLADEYENT